MYDRDIGALIAPKQAVAPQSASAVVNGGGIDRSNYLSATIAGLVGAASGSPTAVAVAFKLQHSPDNSTWTDVSGATVTANAASTEVDVDVDLSELDQYVRVVATPTLTGGTSPAVQVAAALILGGANELPV